MAIIGSATYIDMHGRWLSCPAPPPPAGMSRTMTKNGVAAWLPDTLTARACMHAGPTGFWQGAANGPANAGQGRLAAILDTGEAPPPPPPRAPRHECALLRKGK